MGMSSSPRSRLSASTSRLARSTLGARVDAARSSRYCDGSHKGTDQQPVVFTAEKTETVWLCGCKHTQQPPFCDGIAQVSYEHPEAVRPVAGTLIVAASR